MKVTEQKEYCYFRELVQDLYDILTIKGHKTCASIGAYEYADNYIKISGENNYYEVKVRITHHTDETVLSISSEMNIYYSCYRPGTWDKYIKKLTKECAEEKELEEKKKFLPATDEMNEVFKDLI